MDFRYHYNSKDEENFNRKEAKALMKEEEWRMERYKKWGGVFPNDYRVNLFIKPISIPMNETNFHHTWKTKLHDIIWYGHVVDRAPIGGLMLTHEKMLDPHSKLIISDTQPDLEGLHTDFSKYPYVFTKEWHPRSFDLLWKKPEDEGLTIANYGIFDHIKKDIDENLRRETYHRKFYYYLQWWDKWTFIYRETSYLSPDFFKNNVLKAENYLYEYNQKHPESPIPFYDKDKDPYWQIRKPTGYEILYEDRKKEADHQLNVYFGSENDYVDAEQFKDMRDMMKVMSSDNWRSREALDRIFATFPFLNKQILDENAPEFKKRMKLVDAIMENAPEFSPKGVIYKNSYILTHPDLSPEEWAWRLGAILNAFAPSDPMHVQHHRLLLDFFFSQHKPQDKEKKYLSEYFETRYIEQKEILYADCQFTAINNLLHCDNVESLYGSWAAIKASGIICKNTDEYNRYMKIMEINHDTLYGNGKPLFSKRDVVRRNNLMQIMDVYAKQPCIYANKDGTYKNHFLTWNQDAVLFKTDRPISDSKNRSEDIREKGIHVLFRTLNQNYQILGTEEQSNDRFFMSPSYHVSPTEHWSIFLSDLKYRYAISMSNLEQNESVGVYFLYDRDQDILSFSNDDPYNKNNRVAITIDFNKHKDIGSYRKPYDPDILTKWVPDCDMEEIFSWIPKLQAYRIPFSITDTGLLTIFYPKTEEIYDKDNGVYKNDIYEKNPISRFFAENMELFTKHPFYNPQVAMMCRQETIYMFPLTSVGAVKGPGEEKYGYQLLEKVIDYVIKQEQEITNEIKRFEVLHDKEPSHHECYDFDFSLLRQFQNEMHRPLNWNELACMWNEDLSPKSLIQNHDIHSPQLEQEKPDGFDPAE